MARPRSQGLLFGLALVAAGLLLLLGQLRFFDLDLFWRFWPTLLVLLGLLKLIQGPFAEGRIWGAGLLTAGLLLQASHLGLLRVNLWQLWPLWLVVVGLLMAWEALRGRRRKPEVAAPISRLNHFAMFGGGEVRSNAANFEGGDVLVLFGGYDVDLTKASIAGDEAVISAHAVFGGIEIKVPEGWSVMSRGIALFGGYGDSTTHPPAGEAASTKRLIVKGLAMFGGVEMKN